LKIPPAIPFGYQSHSFPFQTINVDTSLTASSDGKNFCIDKIVDPPLMYINQQVFPVSRNQGYFVTMASPVVSFHSRLLLVVPTALR